MTCTSQTSPFILFEVECGLLRKLCKYNLALSLHTKSSVEKTFYFSFGVPHLPLYIDKTEKKSTL